MSCLYVLEINPLSVVSVTNIFFHSEGCFLILFIVSFAVQKLLIRSHLFIFDMYILPCIIQITNENLLYGTGNSTQCSAVT